MKTIELRPISKFTKGGNSSICISPKFWGWGLMQGREAKAVFMDAQEKAKQVDDICIAVVHDDLFDIDYVLGEHTGKMFTKFILFNAKEELSSKAGAITVFMRKDLPGGEDFTIIEKHIRFEKNSIF